MEHVTQILIAMVCFAAILETVGVKSLGHLTTALVVEMVQDVLLIQHVVQEYAHLDSVVVQ